MQLRDDEERKRVVKEAIDEWLEHKIAVFGRWSLAGVLAALISVIGYFYFTTHGVGR